jgi:ketosteroid isomerase-like protein
MTITATHTPTQLDPAGVDRLVDDHFRAEIDQDLDALLATFADDVEHEVVGLGPVSHGKRAVDAFYRALFAGMRFESIENIRRYHGPGFVVDESVVHARASERPVTFRLLHLFETANGRISRENAWLDTSALTDGSADA